MAEQNNNTAAEVSAVSNLVAALLPSMIQYGIPMVEKVVAMIKQDPSIPASALQQTIQARLDAAAKNNQTVIGETA